MTSMTAGDAPGDRVLAALGSIRESLTDLQDAALWARSDREALAGVREGFAVKQQLESVWLGLVADLDTRPAAVSVRDGSNAQTFLRVLNRTASQARNDIRAARALTATSDDPALPVVAAAFAAGRISREHVDVAVRTIHKIPKTILSRLVPDLGPDFYTDPATGLPGDPYKYTGTGSGSGSGTGTGTGTGGRTDGDGDATGACADATIGPDGESTTDIDATTGPDGESTTGSTTGGNTPGGSTAGEPGLVTVLEAVDTFFAYRSRQYDPAQLAALARSLLNALDPDGADGFNPDAVNKRKESHVREASGMLIGRFVLDPVTGAWWAAAIDHFSAPDPTRIEYGDDGLRIPVRDTRAPEERQADAMGLIARLALGSLDAGTKGGEAPRFVIHTTLPDLHDTRCPHTHSDDDHPSDDHPSDDHPTGDHPTDDRTSNDRTSNDHLSDDRTSDGDRDTKSDGVSHDRTDSSTGHERAEKTTSALEITSGRQKKAGAEPSPQQLPGRPADASPDRMTALPGRRMQGGTCDHLGAIASTLMARFACDAILQTAVLDQAGAILNLGRDVRTVTPAQRRALVARDRGCTVPGCTAKAQWCEGHHVRWWSMGGLSDIGNYALVCGRHHTEIHLGIIQMIMRDGVPYVQLPFGVDPWQRWVRNTFHQDTDHARALGTQLRLTLPEDPYPDTSFRPPMGPPPDYNDMDRRPPKPRQPEHSRPEPPPANDPNDPNDQAETPPEKDRTEP